jgi:hypothetical protein
MCFIRSAQKHPLWTHPHKLYPYNHLWRLSWQILIDEVITCVSLSTGMLPATEGTNTVKSWVFASMGSWTQDLRCYWGSCNCQATDPSLSRHSPQQGPCCLNYFSSTFQRTDSVFFSQWISISQISMKCGVVRGASETLIFYEAAP